MAPTTISATRPGRSPSPNSPVGRRLARFGSPRACGRRAGFSLFEIVLAIGILAILTGAMVLGVGGWFNTQRIDEGARRLESILRLARAESASRGRRIRLAFDVETLQPSIEWEPLPLREAGQYVPLPAGWAHDLPTEELRFITCRRTGESALQMLTFEENAELATEDGGILQSVTFYPDGSCDSAVIEVGDPEQVDLRIGRIDLNGATGTIGLRILTPTEYADQELIDAEAEGL